MDVRYVEDLWEEDSQALLDWSSLKDVVIRDVPKRDERKVRRFLRKLEQRGVDAGWT